MAKKIKHNIKEFVAHLKTLCRNPSVPCLVLAHELVIAYKAFEVAPFSVLFPLLCSKKMKEDDAALYKAGKLIASKLDEDLSANHHNNSYHSADHLRTVLTNVFVINQLSERSEGPAPSLDVLIAAMIHDADHDGGTNSADGQRKPFHLEDKAMAYALPLLREAKVDEGIIQNIHAMLRWTDLEGRAQDMAKIYPQGLAPAVVEKAKMLGDADLLAAIGLTGQQAYKEDRKLGLELKRPFSAENFRSFVMSVAGEGFHSKGGQYFNPNIEGVLAHMDSLVVKRYNPKIALTL